MKRMIRTLAVAAFLVAAMTCTAFADDQYTTNIDGTVTYNTANESFTATYEGSADDAGKEMVLLVVKTNEKGGYSIDTEGSILYIDQKAADENGDVTFEDFIPSTVTDSVVLLGAKFTDGESPKKLGTIISQYTLGDVNNDGSVRSNDALLTLRIAAEDLVPVGNQFKAAEVNGDGNVRSNDALLILRYAAEDITEFPIESKQLGGN